jgi:hypothetical protein
MNLIIDVAVLLKALVHQDRDYGLCCRQLWDYICQFEFLHICLDEGFQIDKEYESYLALSKEYQKWITEVIPRRYARPNPPRYPGELGSPLIADPLHRVLLSVAIHSKGTVVAEADDAELFREAATLEVKCLESCAAAHEVITAVQRWLRLSICRSFSVDDLRLLCADLGVDFESFGDSGHEIVVLKIISFFDRRIDLAKLLNSCKQARPGQFDNYSGC